MQIFIYHIFKFLKSFVILAIFFTNKGNDLVIQLGCHVNSSLIYSNVKISGRRSRSAGLNGWAMIDH